MVLDVHLQQGCIITLSEETTNRQIGKWFIYEYAYNANSTGSVLS